MSRVRPGSSGKRYEDVALRFLLGLGYRVTERNWRCPMGELDLVAFEGDTLVFVEVRARAAGAPYRPEETVSLAKQRRVAAAAQAYLETSSWEGPCRFDVVAVDIGQAGTTARLIRDAFTA
ncbi:MAG: YraN family protein [Anaerolineae bacterium]|nr:YraN family protein [Anaerolineae bacterium]